MKAQKKPVIIDFIEYNEDLNEIKEWVKSFEDDFEKVFLLEDDHLKVYTMEGTSYDVTKNDVIIRGIKGEYYPCNREIFEQTYDRL